MSKTTILVPIFASAQLRKAFVAVPNRLWHAARFAKIWHRWHVPAVSVVSFATAVRAVVKTQCLFVVVHRHPFKSRFWRYGG